MSLFGISGSPLQRCPIFAYYAKMSTFWTFCSIILLIHELRQGSKKQIICLSKTSKNCAGQANSRWWLSYEQVHFSASIWLTEKYYLSNHISMSRESHFWATSGHLDKSTFIKRAKSMWRIGYLRTSWNSWGQVDFKQTCPTHKQFSFNFEPCMSYQKSECHFFLQRVHRWEKLRKVKKVLNFVTN